MNRLVPLPLSTDSAITWRDLLRLVLFSLALFLALVAILVVQFLPNTYQLSEGDVSNKDIRSPVKVTYVSSIQTQEERASAAAAVADVFTFDVTVASQQRQKANDAFSQISEIRRQPLDVMDREAKKEAILGLPKLSLSAAAVDDILNMSNAEWQALNSEMLRVLDSIMRGRVAHKDLADVQSTIPSLVSTELSPSQSRIVAELVLNFVEPNFLLDTEATEQAREKAAAEVQPVRYTLENGEMILRDGDIVRPIHLEQLEAAGLKTPSLHWQDIAGAAFLAGVLVSVMSLYLLFYRPVIISNERRLLLIAVIIIVAVVAAKMVVPGRELYGYLFPAAAVAMLLATLLDAEMAVMPAIVVAVLLGIISNNSLEFATLALVGGLIGMLGARRMERINSFFITGAEIAAANFLIILGFHLASGEFQPDRLLMLAFISVVNGALCAVLTLGSFSVLGHIFGITTSLGLLELAHPTQPLFRRLLTEAPGTYHHSVVVANLSERATQVIGGDALLARVGAYYHDIGKIVHPYFFIENQLNGENVHDRLDPRTSVHSIAAHVSDGLQLARRHGLPSKVVDIIEQHHGTSLVRYFYYQACNENREGVNPEDFSYSGPKPQSREAAIVMLADSVEAVVRANRSRSNDNLDELVNKAVTDRLTEGQLDECDLTLRQLEIIKRTFVSVLQGIFHPRITYPEAVEIPKAGSIPVEGEKLAEEG